MFGTIVAMGMLGMIGIIMAWAIWWTQPPKK